MKSNDAHDDARHLAEGGEAGGDNALLAAQAAFDKLPTLGPGPPVFIFE
jgi:hypothetical protein